MNPSVVSVQPTDEYKLIVSFDNSDTKLFDVSPYLDKGIFQEVTTHRPNRAMLLISLANAR